MTEREWSLERELWQTRRELYEAQSHLLKTQYEAAGAELARLGDKWEAPTDETPA